VGMVDSHHHLWDTHRLRYPLFDGIPALNRPFTIDDFEQIAAAHEVEASVCVEAASAGADPLAEMAWLREQADRSDRLKALVVWAPVDQPDLPSYLDRMVNLRDARIVGVRRSFEFEPPDFASRRATVAGVQRLADHGLSFDLVLFHPALPAAVELVRKCPDVQFVLDHLGKPPIRARRIEPWRSHIAELASLPNVVCKISGMTTEANRDGWTADDLVPYFDHAVESFGWNRLLFGSDWPVCNLAGGYEPWLHAVDVMLSGVSPDDRSKFFSGNAKRVYRLEG
jgi:L-fuconolactonase